MGKDKNKIPIFMTLNYRCFENWMKEYNSDKWAYLTEEDRKILIPQHCQIQWRKLYHNTSDYNIE